MKWTVGQKMVLLGFIAIIGLGVLAGNNFMTTNSIEKFLEIETLRNDQINTVNGTLQAQLTLMLNAMDAIIDKDEGNISKERHDAINVNVELINKNLKSLEELSDTDEEKRLSKDLQTAFAGLSTGIQKDLVNLIKESGARMAQIQNDFTALDDTLDNYGDPFEEELVKIYNSVFEEQKEATALAVLRNTQTGVLTEMIRAHGSLMLAAMDSIIDKDEGTIDPERVKSINASVAFTSKNLDALVELADTGEEKKSAEFIRDSFPKLAKGIQVDLTRLIESRASQSEFSQIDNVLDNYGDPIDQELVKIYTSVSEEQKEATDLATLRNTQMSLLNKMIRAHGSLMLGAMDAIIDKDAGTIDPDRIKSINENVAFLTDHLDDLVKLGDTEAERKSALLIKEIFPKLAKGIQVDLKNLIEKSSVEANQIHEAFTKIDDNLDAYGDRVESNLLGIQASVQEELLEAKEASQKTISRSKLVGWITSIVVLVVLLVALILISRSIIGPITRISGELREGANQVASASGEVSSSSQSLAEGTSEQAASIEETSSSMEEMSSMTKKNAENASHADNLMKDSNKVVEEANQSMDQLIQSMDDISKASEETSKIIKTIDEIAFQTNLLALNAAVEAARAGEAGAGFAVVADEVRNLAMRAADAAKDTAQLIEGIVKKVNYGSELVSTTNNAFSKVADSSSKVGSLVAEISEASSEQSEGINQVNNTVAEMDKVVQQNAANAEESASASEEMAAQAEQMKIMVSSLVALVSKDEQKIESSSNRQNSTMITRYHETEAPPKKMLTKIKGALGNKKEIRADQVIPFDDEDDFESF